MNRSHFGSAIVNDRKSRCGQVWNYYKVDQDEPIQTKKQDACTEKTAPFCNSALFPEAQLASLNVRAVCDYPDNTVSG